MTAVITVARKSSCATCGGEMLPIAYGFPSGEMFEASERGELVLGGCVVWSDMPMATCPSCPAEDRGTS